MKRAFVSVTAAAFAALTVGSIALAGAPVSKKPAGSHTDAHGTSKKKDPPISKWQQHVDQMLKVSAPGDEYFGHMKMSYLGINNTFRDDLIRAGAYTTDPRMVGQIHWADDALLSWAKKYPNDPQLARSYFLAFLMYRKIWIQEYQQKAWDYAHIVLKKWPDSYFGKTLKKDLAIGFTEHYFATPVACADLPSGSPSPNAKSTASPVPSPSPTLTPTPAPGQPKTDVLPVPCTTPSPTPTPIPTGSLTPAPSSPPTSSSTPTPTPTPSP